MLIAVFNLFYFMFIIGFISIIALLILSIKEKDDDDE